jgi:hypothetical protein
MGNCHDCKSFLTKTELTLGLFETSDDQFAIINENSQNPSKYPKFSPKLSALCRGYHDRKQFLYYYKQSLPEYPYFSINEVKETLSKNIGLAKFKEKRGEFRFKNGKYSGEWCGGFRHGFGTMEWNDGCKYEGHWQFSRPSGSGSFIFKNGEGYQGDWKVYYIFSKSVFRTGKLEQYKECVQDGYRKS